MIAQLYTTNNTIIVQRRPRFSERMAKFSFAIYMFFILFGTSIPFRDTIRNIDEIGTSNIINQIVFSTLFLTSFLSILPKWHQLLLILKAERWLFIFIAWCGISIMWSDFPFVSFKRLFQILTTISVVLAFLLHIDSIDEIFHYLIPLLYVYIVLSILSILLIPGAIYHDHLWRGLAKSKNHLGQACLVSSILWYSYFQHPRSKYKIVYLAMLGLSIVLLAGSRSVTSIITTLIFLFSTVLLRINGHLERYGFNNLFLFYCVFLPAVVFAFIITIFPFFLPDILGGLGKDLTFTGRTDLWDAIYQHARQHPVLGSGYGGFWVIDSPKLSAIYRQFVWIPRQAHMGYLDMVNETGIIGLGIFLSMIIQYYKNFLANKNNWMQYFVICALIINLQESTLFRTNILTGVFFILAYLSLYAQKVGIVDH